jgi:hypothetical protein
MEAEAVENWMQSDVESRQIELMLCLGGWSGDFDERTFKIFSNGRLTQDSNQEVWEKTV